MRIVPSLQSQRGYLLITVVVMLFLVASIAMLLNHDSAISANTSSSELEAARADYVAQAGMQHALWRAENNACMGDVTIPDTTLGNDTYSATITGAAAGTAYTLSPDQDAWIRNDDVTNNNGTTADQHLRLETGKIEQALTRFDLSSLPEDAQILSATAWFYVTASGPGGGAHPEGPLTVHRVTSDWTETGATWETMNGEFENSKLATIPAQPVDAVWVSFNLTGQVQAWANGQPNYGILMAPTAEGTHGKYSSREDGGNAPRLEVVVGSGAASPVTVRARSELTNGVKRALKDKIATAYQPLTSTAFQPGAEGKDGGVRAAQSNDNFGAAIEVTISGGANPEHFLAQFAVEQIPKGSRIVSARLEMYLNYLSSADPAAEFSVHRMTEPWTEGSGDSWNPGDGANWNTSDGSTVWDWQTNHDTATAIDTTAVDPGFTGWHSWDIADLVRRWTSGDMENYGVVIKGNANVSKAWFRTSDWSDPSQHPRLIVEYACECGSPCMVLQGSGNVLVPASSSSNPNPDELLRIELLESLGYVVEPYWAKNSQGNWNSKMANFDVVYVPATANAADIGTKLTNAPIGVVHELGALNDELGFESTGSSNWPVGKSVTVTDASHYITAPFAAGALNIYDVDMGGLAIGGTPADGVEPLADWQSSSGLAVLEAGAKTADGGAAAGRRAMLPFGQDSQINWSQVNNNGRLILQRALAWGMGVGKTNAGDLLMVVVDPSSLTTQEQAKKTLIESWGYSVNLIDESASQGAFDTAVATADVVYIAEDIASGQLGTKLREATIGVVIEEEKITDEFGISSGETTFTEASIEITNNTHYITTPFSLGTITFVSSAQPVGGRGGTLAPGLAVLAERPSSSTSMLDVIDTGGALFDSGTAAGRRVKLPWGGNGFDINSLTDDGQTVMKRAIDWAAGSGCGSTTPLWMLVADANNPTAEENTRQTLLESWCYAVTLGTASEPLEVYDKYAENFDIVYVAASVNYADVGSKLKFQPIGVVAEPSILSSRLGFTSGTSGYTGTVTELTDNSHYIASGFPLGNLALTMTSTSLRHFTNTMGPGFKTLSVRPTQTDPMIMTLDTGDELLWGGQAPDRRVMLPWGGSSTFDVRNLTNDGLTILQRAIEWAGGAGPSPGHIAHWKLDETSGTTAVDSVGGHDGTLMNMDPATDWVPGQLGGALEFDGTNDYIDVSSMNPMSYDDFTIVAWYKSTDTSASDDEYIFAHENGTTDELTFGPTDDVSDRLRLGINRGGTWDPHYGTSDIVDQQWHHLVAVRSGGRIRLYVDNVKETDEVDALAGLTVTIDGDGPFIGDYPGVTEQVHGTLDDVRLYDRGLSDAEISDLFTAGGGGGGSGGGGSGGGGGGGGGGPEYLDHFDIVAYSGSDGSTDWSGDPWQELTESDGPGSGKLLIASDPVVAQSASERLVVDSRFTELKRPVDLSGFSSAYLSFNYRRDGYPTPSDYFAVVVSDNGSTWTQLERIYGIANDPVYRAAVYDISAFATSNTEIRIATGGINNNQTLYIDDMRVASTPLTGCAGVFADQFDTKSYANNDGTLNWASDWTEIKESDGPTKGDIQVRNEINNYQLRVRDGGYGVWREADLTAAGQATLILDFKRVGLDSSSDYVTVDVSSDGGSNWTELDRFAGSGNDNLYQFRYYDITAHATVNTRIRFLGSATLGGTDEVWFDDIKIVCTP